jgi:hypothetical protein
VALFWFKNNSSPSIAKPGILSPLAIAVLIRLKAVIGR